MTPISSRNSGDYNEHADLHKKKDAPGNGSWLSGRKSTTQTFGKGFDCFVGRCQVCNLGVADWKGREAIRENLRAFIDTGFTALHDVTEYWDGGSLKVFSRLRNDDAG